MVAGHRNNGDPGGVELSDAAFEMGPGLKQIIVLVDQISSQGHCLHLLVQGRLDHPPPGPDGADILGLKNAQLGGTFRNAGRTSTQVHVADKEDFNRNLWGHLGSK